MWASVAANLIADLIWAPAGYLLVRAANRVRREVREAMDESRAEVSRQLTAHRVEFAAQLEQYAAPDPAPERKSSEQ